MLLYAGFYRWANTWSAGLIGDVVRLTTLARMASESFKIIGFSYCNMGASVLMALILLLRAKALQNIVSKKLTNADLRFALGDRLVDDRIDRRAVANMARRKHNEFTPDMHELFLMTLAETGMYVRASDACGCNYRDTTAYRRDNPEFQELCMEALHRYRNHFILEAQRRAVVGNSTPIIGGRNRDEVVAHEVKYSDRLLEVFLKRSPDGSFTDKQEITHTGQMDIRQQFDFRSLSKTARSMLRNLLEQMEIDVANRALNKPLDGEED